MNTLTRGCFLGIAAFFLVAVLRTAGAVELGAYYFDGWSGSTDAFHLKPRLMGEFGRRKPIWGWHDNTVEIMQKQIDAAADGGLSFWAFDWYKPAKGYEKLTALNNALSLYLKANNRNRLGFCLLVANHGSVFRIGPAEWPEVTAEWVKLFKEPGYVTANGKPLLIIFLPQDLAHAFGKLPAVKAALDQLRNKAKAAGFPGVTVAACCDPGPKDAVGDLTRMLPWIKMAGFDFATAYNYHGVNTIGTEKQQRYADMAAGHRIVWEYFATKSPLPYIPVVTTGWDRRPAEAVDAAPKDKVVYYPDRSPEAVHDLVKDAIRWTAEHPDRAAKERIILLNAWNELAEGGYLVPTVGDGSVYLDAVKRAAREEGD